MGSLYLYLFSAGDDGEGPGAGDSAADCPAQDGAEEDQVDPRSRVAGGGRAGESEIRATDRGAERPAGEREGGGVCTRTTARQGIVRSSSNVVSRPRAFKAKVSICNTRLLLQLLLRLLLLLLLLPLSLPLPLPPPPRPLPLLY